MMRVVLSLKSCFAVHTPYCIIGAGTGGINLSSHMIASSFPAKDIRIFQNSQYHYYQPGWTMVGANLAEILSTKSPMGHMIHSQIHHTGQKVTKIVPEKNMIVTSRGEEFTYDNLILATGLENQYHKVKGLKELLEDEDSKVCTIYDYKYAHKTQYLGQQFKGGEAIFTEPAMPIKCAGAPQKILYLLTHQWKEKKIASKVSFFKTIGVMFGIPKYAKTLEEVAAKLNISVTFKHNLIEVTPTEAIFQSLDTKEIIRKPYNFLHVVPPMGATSLIAEAGLADASGYLSVNRDNLRHTKYPNIWGIGDCLNSPNAKTAAAIFSQTAVIDKNFRFLRNQPTATELPEKYDGYSSCPLFTGGYDLMLAEFKYDGVVDETFFSNQEKPNWMFYFMKRFVFPLCYWNCVPRGLWNGRKGFRYL